MPLFHMIRQFDKSRKTMPKIKIIYSRLRFLYAKDKRHIWAVFLQTYNTWYNFGVFYERNLEQKLKPTSKALYVMPLSFYLHSQLCNLGNYLKF